MSTDSLFQIIKRVRWTTNVLIGIGLVLALPVMITIAVWLNEATDPTGKEDNAFISIVSYAIGFAATIGISLVAAGALKRRIVARVLPDLETLVRAAEENRTEEAFLQAWEPVDLLFRRTRVRTITPLRDRLLVITPGGFDVGGA